MLLSTRIFLVDLSGPFVGLSSTCQVKIEFLTDDKSTTTQKYCMQGIFSAVMAYTFIHNIFDGFIISNITLKGNWFFHLLYRATLD